MEAIVETVSGMAPRVVPKTNYMVQSAHVKITVERLFGYFKHFRRVATRYDKADLSFLSFAHLAPSIYGSNHSIRSIFGKAIRTVHVKH
ncbi:MAG: hypothetical protein NPIRA04_23150 [Nitrospirales bacterium]|nr:MAG: hypothetical protein NPIRA04_23150 [Nitrospirales bacterium]